MTKKNFFIIFVCVVFGISLVLVHRESAIQNQKETPLLKTNTAELFVFEQRKTFTPTEQQIEETLKAEREFMELPTGGG